MRNVEASTFGVGASNGLRSSLESAEVVFFFFFRSFYGIVIVHTCWSRVKDVSPRPELWLFSKPC